eukprot:scaffold6348_cov259-Pinguiococcus_pyrenoidosus.AAC.11
MQFIPCDVSTHGRVSPRSGRTWQAQVAAERAHHDPPGRRAEIAQTNCVYAPPPQLALVGQPLGGAQGQAADIEIQAKEILYTKALLNGFIADYTGQPLTKIEEDTDRDFFMTPREAHEYGIIDEVIKINNYADLKPPAMPVLRS